MKKTKNQLRIGIDARPLQGETRFRGIGKSFEYLMKAMLRYHSDYPYIFYVDKALPHPDLIQNFPNHQIKYVPTSNLGRRRYFRSFLNSYPTARPSNKDVDVFFQYDATLGVPTSVPTVTIFHDLIPYLFRGQEKKQAAEGLRKYKNKLAGNMYWGKYLRVLKRYKRSAKIIAISQASKRDYIEHLGNFNPKDIVVIHHGFGEDHPAEHKPSAKAKQLASKPFIMYLGGIDLRKNITELVRVFYAIKPDFPDLRLVAVGKEFELNDQLGDVGWNAELAKNKQFAKDVLTPGFLDGSDMSYLYAHAKVFVHPTLYEGFGLPLLEALQAGCPLICYDNSSIPELVGDAAVVVKNGQPLAPHVKKILSDAKLSARLAKAGPKQAAKFTWERTADETLKALLTATGKRT